MNPKRWHWYTWITSIWFILNLSATYGVTGRISLVSVIEAAFLPGLLWVTCFVFSNVIRYVNEP